MFIHFLPNCKKYLITSLVMFRSRSVGDNLTDKFSIFKGIDFECCSNKISDCFLLQNPLSGF